MMSWRTVVTGAGIVAGVTSIVAGVAFRDLEAAVIGAAMLVATALVTWRTFVVFRLALGALFLNLMVWMAPASIANVREGSDAAHLVIPVLLATSALVGLVGVVGAMVAPAAGRVPLVAGALAVGLALAGITSALVVSNGHKIQPGDVVVDMQSLRFSPDDVHVRPGKVTFAAVNHDLFWHTFTVRRTGVDLRVPTGGTRRTSATLTPGTYTLICAIPGHDGAGMKGTIVVG
jgi:plastocyanin